MHPKIPVYQNTGDGRDTYISFFNGGFGRYKLSDTYAKERIDSPRRIYQPDLSLCKPTSKYFTDGNGRDTYVYSGMLAEHDKCKGNLQLSNILRSYYTMDAPRTSQSMTPSKFEKKLINRIFYGKCPGMKDRQLSPKVKFLTKEDIKRKHSEDENNVSVHNEGEEVNSDNNTVNNENKSTKNSKQLGDNLYKNICTTESNKVDEDLQKYTKERKFFYKKKQEPLPETEDLMNSVRKIFLYHNKAKPFINQEVNKNTLNTRTRFELGLTGGSFAQNYK